MFAEQFPGLAFCITGVVLYLGMRGAYIPGPLWAAPVFLWVYLVLGWHSAGEQSSYGRNQLWSIWVDTHLL